MKKALLLFLAFFLFSYTYAQDMQMSKWLHQSPQGNTLRYVEIFDANNIYALGDKGTFMKSSDGGVSWYFHHKASRTTATGVSYYIYDAHFFDMNTGVAVGAGGVTRTTNAGATWDTVYTTGTLYQVYFVNNLIGFAVGTSAVEVIKTTDGGLTWTRTDLSGSLSVYDVYSHDGNTVVVSSSSGNVYRSTDGGTTFGSAISTGTSSSLYKLTFRDSLYGVVGGSSSAVRLTTDGGITWASINTGLPASKTWYDIDLVNNDVFLTGDSFVMFKSSNNGTSWDSVDILDPIQPWTSTYYATDFFNDNFFIVGAFGLINKKIGTTITTSTQWMKGGILYDIWRDPNSSRIIAVGAPTSAGFRADQILLSTNLGATWEWVIPNKANYNGVVHVEPVEDLEEVKGQEKTPNSTATFRTICMINSNVGFIGGSRGAIYKTTNGGTTWDSLTTNIPTTADIWKIDALSENFMVAFSNATDVNGTVFKSTDGGTTWAQIPVPYGTSTSNTRLYSGDVVNENVIFSINYDPVPIKTTDGGLTWALDSLEDNYGGFLYDIQMFDPLNGVICGGAGRFYKTTDGGNLWKADTLSTATLYALSFIDMNRGIVAGSDGLIYQTSDGGATWITTPTQGKTIYGAFLHIPTAGDSVTLYTSGLDGSIFATKSGIVPVELASFTSNVKGNAVTLNWSTATETNNFGFNVERKINGTWNKIGFVSGNGTTTERKVYTFTDNNLQAGKYSYRLKQLDHDGSYNYYNLPEIIEIGTPLDYRLSQNYPNPFNPSTVISYSLPQAGNVSIKVYNIIGAEVVTLVNGYQEAGNYTKQFNASENGLTSGVYFYTIKSGSFTDTKKMVILK